MDENFKGSCPHCCQQFKLKSLSPERDINIPLFLKCGHSMCEICVRKLVKVGEPIACKMCHKVMELRTVDAARLLQHKIEFYKLFPVNVNILGELALDMIMEKSEKAENNEECFIDLQAILASSEQTLGKCLECQSETMKMCQQCATIICQECFDKSHQSFVVFKTHVLKDIEQELVPNNCMIHIGKPLSYYCKDCQKSACLDCLMVGSEESCKSHNVLPTIEMNKTFLDELREVSPQVDAMFNRLTQTAVDIGHQLQDMENDKGASDLENATATIEQHFSKLHAEIQTHRKEVLGIITKLKAIEKDSLIKAKNDVAKAIKDSKNVMSSVKSALVSEENKLANVVAVLDDAKKILTTPWHLSRDESDKNPLKVTVNDDLCMFISDYIQLEGNAKALYKLRASHELDGNIPPPPLAPVFPPLPPTDVGNNYAEAVNKKPAASDEIPQYQTASISDGAVCNENLQRPNPEPQKLAFKPVMNSTPNKYVRPIKSVFLGNKELAKITHMEDLDDFYIQRAYEEASIKKMVEELESNLTKITKRISVDDMYVVNHNKTWMRCQVHSIDDSDANNPTYYVTCLDFGYTLPAKIKNLRDAPTRFAVGTSGGRYPVPLAIRCRLANCKPKNGVWTKSDVDFVRKIIDNKQVTIEVRHVGPHVACDVTTLDGTSIAHELAFHSRAVLLQPNSQVDLQEKFIKLSHNLNQSYSLSDTTSKVDLPDIGLVCVVYVSPEKSEQEGIDYSGWARATVKSTGEGVVKVFLHDIGCCLYVKRDQVRRMKQKFIDIRALASECHLAGPRGEWSEKATDLLNAYKDILLKLKVENEHERKTVGAVLFWESGEETVCINEEVAVHNLAKANRSENMDLRNTTPKSVEEISEIKSPSSAILNEVPPPKLPMMPKPEQKESMSSLRLEAKILHYESPGLIYITVIPQQKTFNELFDDIQKFYTKRKTTRRGNWNVNDRCCALCIKSVTWRRATILDVKKDYATVFYTDFACTETIPISNLKKLHSDFEVIGNAAIKCHLAGVMPAGGEDWPSLAKEFLKDKIDSYKRIFITRVGQFKDKSMPIELWVYHTDQGSALEADKSEWRCLNKAIINQGLAVPEKNYQAENETCGDESLSFLVSDWLQIPPARAMPLSSESSASSPVKAACNITGENTLFISDWLPAEPLKSMEFSGTPTYIDNDGIIYLHDETQSDMLELIRDSLKMGFKDDDPKAQYYNWRVGEPCVARYYLDNSFYRGTVVDVDKEQSQCTIQYVDYGNYEVCAFTDLRKGIALHQIPIQAHTCFLSGIRPIGGKWDLPALDYIHKAIVEKKCYVKVTGEPIDGNTPIYLKYDKLWINDHLVEFEMATYTDGSKPLVRRFIPIEGKVVKTERVIKVEADSEPDYIIEEENGSCQVSGSPDSFKIATMMTETDPHNGKYELTESILSYPKHEKEEFDCNITVINDTNTLELIIDHGEKNAEYEKLFETVEKEGENMLPLVGVFENKPCIALFPEDNKWYRAVILQYSEPKNLVKVRYVDYGNIGIISLQNVREINEEWVKLPPASISVRLHGVKVNPDFHTDDVTKVYVDTFLDKGPFHVRIIHYKNLPCVEFRNTKNELVYQEMIDSTVFLYDTCDPLS